MTSFGPYLHVFIIRARREPREIPGAPPEHRFWVEHHPGGEQRNFKDFIGVLDFIVLYLPEIFSPAVGSPELGNRFAFSWLRPAEYHPETTDLGRAMRRYHAAPATAPRISLRRIPRGYAGTLRTANHVKQLIRDGAKDFYVRQRAIDIMLSRGVRPKNYRGEIEALFEWVQRHVRYTKDPFRVEVLHSPRRMLELRAGDCDDMTILLGAMLEAIGHSVRLVLTGPDPSRPRLFSHIYLEVNCRGRVNPSGCNHAASHGLVPPGVGQANRPA